jgi:hypothetical protein
LKAPDPEEYIENIKKTGLNQFSHCNFLHIDDTHQIERIELDNIFIEKKKYNFY